MSDNELALWILKVGRVKGKLIGLCQLLVEMITDSSRFLRIIQRALIAYRVLVHCGNTATGCIIIQLCAMYNVSITTSCVSNAVNKMIDAGAQNILLLDNIGSEGSSTRRLVSVPLAFIL